MYQQNKQNTITNRQQSQQSYFHLIEIVGDHGKYQNISLIVWCILWLVVGAILLGTPFMMLNPPYICSNNSNSSIALMDQQKCQQYVCSLPQSSRTQFYDHSYFISVSNNFQDLHCQKSWISDLLSSLIYCGCFFGYISISILVDNLGRKKSIIISILICLIGLILAVVSQSLVMVGIGLFFAGCGGDSGINICFYYITQTMEAKHRQRYSILIQVFFSLGGVVNIAFYFLLKNWRLVTWIFYIAPMLISLVVILAIVKDTPYFLIKLKKPDVILNQLSYIYKLNNGSEITQQKQTKLRQLIQKLQTSQIAHQIQIKGQHNTANKSRRIYSPIDLFRYISIRYISLGICGMSLIIYMLYYGPLMLISKFSFSLYINALVVTGSQIITYPFSYFLIHKLQRRKLGVILLVACSIIAFVLIFVVYNQCQTCTFLRVMELILIFMFRFCSSLQFAVFLVYCNEIFPTQVRGLGIGISSAIGTMASTSSPYIFGSRVQTNHGTSNIMIVLSVISLISAIIQYKLPQTLNKPIQDQISQINAQKVQKIQTKDRQNLQGHIQLVQIKQGD